MTSCVNIIKEIYVAIRGEMAESISQGIPSLDLNDKGLKLYKCNDISFSNLRKIGFTCLRSNKKPDQIVAYGGNILVGIEDKANPQDMEIAVLQIKERYLDALPGTEYFIARAGELTKCFNRTASNQIVEIGTTLKGKEVVCFGPKIITGENKDAKSNLMLLAEQALAGKKPINGSIEVSPAREYFNPLLLSQNIIFKLWQDIFVSTGENAHNCLYTFIELLLYKGISDADMLPNDYSIDTLADPNRSNSLDTYKNVVRRYIKTTLFPTPADQPGVINSFAFAEQETVFRSILKNLCSLGNLAQRQIDPDFKRRVIEAFLGSAHREGTIKSGKHLTPRNVISAIWEMADPIQGKRIVDPACGVGGFVLEGLNYPYEFDVLKYDCFGIDRDEQMIITAKANMLLHILDKFADPNYDRRLLAQKVNSTFYHATNNGTGTLGELSCIPDGTVELQPIHQADYVFSNVPFYTSGVSQIDNSLKDIGKHPYYAACGLGVESRFLKYILGQIKNGDPGLAFVIVTDGVLYRHNDRIRKVLNENADMLGIISLPVGCFQNNNWKTSILIFKKKTSSPEYSPVFLYNVENIGISLDAYRTPIEQNNIPGLKKAWQKRPSGIIEDPLCKLVPRDEFLRAKRWSDLFAWCREVKKEGDKSFSEFIESAEFVNTDIADLLRDANRNLSDIFALDKYIEIEVGDKKHFNTRSPVFKTTVKHARLNPGKYPLFSSQVDGPVEYMEDSNNSPILIENEGEGKDLRLISWNIKGDPCKDIRQHDTPFYATENRGLIEILNDKIDYRYVLYYLRERMTILGNFKRSDEAHVGKVKKLKIKIPVDDKGQISLEKQESIARNYRHIIDLRKEMASKVSQLNDLVTNIDVFK